ncbi:putative ATP-dependent permease [Martiniozyma asiatica (nom. inval.)]|nr:putative ATP-dependent permease [Martiniozyma asiatica]
MRLVSILGLVTLSVAYTPLEHPIVLSSSKKTSLWSLEDSDKCPPCFNCNLPNFQCAQFSQCNTFSGRCECLSGYGGDDCSKPLCGGLSDGINRPIRDDNSSCECSSGWGGINCNMCQDDSVCDSFVPQGLKGTCFKSGILVNKFHQVCDVTNAKIVDILNGKKPQVTFSCNKTSEACDFQFWIDEKESFYCDLEECNFKYDLNSNSTHYSCQKAQCECLPGRMLCGENGSIDISDFLTHEISGPGDFSCDINSMNCKFSEPSMNNLISSVFGDPQINLQCKSGECLHKSEIPGFKIPSKERFTLIDFTKILSVFMGLATVSVLLGQKIKSSPLFTQPIQLDDNNNQNSHNSDLFLENYKEAIFSFKNVNYGLNNQAILNAAFGSVSPGECMAIMGSSGAGKSTLLDILAGKNKSGYTEGDIFINGKRLDVESDIELFKNRIGFVNQDDIMISTLTVYETVLNSALLRLPKSMSLSAKQNKVLDILSELKICHIKDKIIGSEFQRGISGGEKRRVAIACELVTSPSILFLDEPTSGLDGYNAFNVIDCLVKLAKNYNRTIIFTIHQPRSNIVALFDKLVLLSHGDILYSGPMNDCAKYFASNGFSIPIGYNIADYLIDISNEKIEVDAVPEASVNANDNDNGDENNNNNSEHIHNLPTVSNTTNEWAHYAQHRDELRDTLLPNKKILTTNDRNLAQLFQNSYIFNEVLANINSHITSSNNDKFFEKDPTLSKPGFLIQLSVLSSRTFKNLYRNPKLLLAHYALSLIMGLFCSYLYYNVENNISGFQNRLGLFFFLLTLFGFSTLTGLDSFAKERVIFIRERSNNYYHPISYYISKILCDVLPLRIFPPIILIAIIYPLVGLNMAEYKFWISIAVLVLFNLATSMEVMMLGIIFKDAGSATMISVLVLLFSLLFSGLFINKESIPIGLKWIEKISIFHYAYEALAVNEVNGLVLKEKKYGLNIEVPGAVILSTFGFDVSAIYWDIGYLGSLFIGSVIIGGFVLCKWVYEMR